MHFKGLSGQIINVLDTSHDVHSHNAAKKLVFKIACVIE